jgi:hypothetical protein
MLFLLATDWCIFVTSVSIAASHVALKLSPISSGLTPRLASAQTVCLDTELSFNEIE